MVVVVLALAVAAFVLQSAPVPSPGEAAPQSARDADETEMSGSVV